MQSFQIIFDHSRCFKYNSASMSQAHSAQPLRLQVRINFINSSSHLNKHSMLLYDILTFSYVHYFIDIKLHSM